MLPTCPRAAARWSGLLSLSFFMSMMLAGSTILSRFFAASILLSAMAMCTAVSFDFVILAVWMISLWSVYILSTSSHLPLMTDLNTSFFISWTSLGLVFGRGTVCRMTSTKLLLLLLLLTVISGAAAGSWGGPASMDAI